MHKFDHVSSRMPEWASSLPFREYTHFSFFGKPFIAAAAYHRRTFGGGFGVERREED